jgi:hypothetical protein
MLLAKEDYILVKRPNGCPVLTLGFGAETTKVWVCREPGLGLTVREAARCLIVFVPLQRNLR